MSLNCLILKKIKGRKMKNLNLYKKRLKRVLNEAKKSPLKIRKEVAIIFNSENKILLKAYLGSEVDLGNKYAPEAVYKICSRCHREASGEAKFCSWCGNNITNTKKRYRTQMTFALLPLVMLAAKSSKEDISLKDKEIYLSKQPSVQELLVALHAGVKRLIYIKDNKKNRYIDDLIKKSKIEIIEIEKDDLK